MWSECDCVIYQRRTRGEGQLRPWHGHRCEHHWCVLNTDFPIPRRRESLQCGSVGPRLHQSQKRAGSIRSEQLQHFYYNTLPTLKFNASSFISPRTFSLSYLSDLVGGLSLNFTLLIITRKDYY